MKKTNYLILLATLICLPAIAQQEISGNRIKDGTVDNTKLSDANGWTLKARNSAVSGNPEDVSADDIAEEASPEAGDFILGFDAADQLRKYDVDNLPGGGGAGDALVANPLSQFAATSSAQLAGVLSDETGSGVVVFGTSPTLITPALGTPSALVGTNITGTAAGLTVGATTGVEAGADITDEDNVTDALDGAILADIGTPASTDRILLQDDSDSGVVKTVDFSEFGSGGGGRLLSKGIAIAPYNANRTHWWLLGRSSQNGGSASEPAKSQRYVEYSSYGTLKDGEKITNISYFMGASNTTADSELNDFDLRVYLMPVTDGNEDYGTQDIVYSVNETYVGTSHTKTTKYSDTITHTAVSGEHVIFVAIRGDTATNIDFSGNPAYSLFVDLTIE